MAGALVRMNHVKLNRGAVMISVCGHGVMNLIVDFIGLDEKNPVNQYIQMELGNGLETIKIRKRLTEYIPTGKQKTSPMRRKKRARNE